MSAGAAVGGMVAVIAARKQEQIFCSFRQRAATSAPAALSLEDLGLSHGPMLRMQILKGAVLEVGAGRYYLDEAAVAGQQRRRQWVMLGLLVVIALMIFGVWSSG